jgi:hypothetical protein
MQTTLPASLGLIKAKDNVSPVGIIKSPATLYSFPIILLALERRRRPSAVTYYYSVCGRYFCECLKETTRPRRTDRHFSKKQNAFFPGRDRGRRKFFPTPTNTFRIPGLSFNVTTGTLKQYYNPNNCSLRRCTPNPGQLQQFQLNSDTAAPFPPQEKCAPPPTHPQSLGLLPEMCPDVAF